MPQPGSVNLSQRSGVSFLGQACCSKRIARLWRAGFDSDISGACQLSVTALFGWASTSPRVVGCLTAA